MLKKILIGLAGLVVLLALVGFFLPSKWHIKREVVIKAKGETIVPMIADLRKWQDWMPWNKEMDPQAQWTYSGTESGVGATMNWKGPRLGSGTLTLTQADAAKGITYEMKMEESQTPAQGSISFTTQADGTKVTWVDEGDMGMNLPGRYFIPLMEKMLNEHFQQGLDHLKGLAETAQAQTGKAAAPAAPGPAAPEKTATAAE